VRWDKMADGELSGDVVEKHDSQENAQEACDYYNDMLNPEFWSERGCVFGRETS